MARTKNLSKLLQDEAVQKDLAKIYTSMKLINHFAGWFSYTVEDAAAGRDMISVRPLGLDKGPYFIPVPTVEELERALQEDPMAFWRGVNATTFEERIHTLACRVFLRVIHSASRRAQKVIGVFMFRLGICGQIEIETNEDLEWVFLSNHHILNAFEIMLEPRNALR